MYSFLDAVRYSEVDKTGKLSIPAMVNYMQDCSSMQSDSLGLGFQHLKETHKTWVLTSWQIDFFQEVNLGEEIEVGTWAYDAKGIYGYRNFLIRTKEGTPIAKTNSIWVLLNTETGVPVRVTPEDVLPYGTEPKLEMEYQDRRIKISGDGKAEQPFSIRKYHIDTNGHVNNCWYIQFAMEYLPDMEEGLGKIKRLRAEYKTSAVYGDVIYPMVYQEEGKITVSLNDVDGKVYSVVQLEY
ncbi:MAG: thioesterase [Lachnospiraceae bacterium]|nr:thioesterase [Lachnospiraceae bacterium]